MTIETAYTAFAAAVQVALREAEYLLPDGPLEIDPDSPFEPSGDEEDLIRAAALVKLRTYVARQAMGRPAGSRRYVVERECRVELAMAGPNRAGRLVIEPAAVAALALLPEVNPTLNGACERLVMGERTDDELPPNGAAVFLTFTLRVRSGDPMGMSA